MTIQPSNRSDGSEHVLRFRGTLAFDVAAPFDNGTINEAYVQNARLTCRFAMCDTTDVANTRRKLPSWVYDDPTPATATRPQAVALQTWAENAKVRMVEVVAAGVAAGVLTYIGDMPSEFTWELDTASAGLQRSTQVPVLVIEIQSAANDAQAFGTPEIILEVTVPHSIIR